jgi:Coenzyme PQQ synthesis protein D (PqqD)
VTGAISDQTVLRRADAVVDADLGEEVVLLDTSRGVAFRLNPAAAWLWDRLREPTHLGGLAEGLAERFAIDLARASADTEDFATKMVGRGLIESDEGAD